MVHCYVFPVDEYPQIMVHCYVFPVDEYPHIMVHCYVFPVDEYPHIEKCPYLNDPELRDRTFIEFRCDIFYNASLVTSDARYRGSFLFDNKTDPGVPSIIISPPTTSFILDEQYLYLRLNKYVSKDSHVQYIVLVQYIIAKNNNFTRELVHNDLNRPKKPFEWTAIGQKDQENILSWCMTYW